MVEVQRVYYFVVASFGKSSTGTGNINITISLSTHNHPDWSNFYQIYVEPLKRIKKYLIFEEHPSVA